MSNETQKEDLTDGHSGRNDGARTKKRHTLRNFKKVQKEEKITGQITGSKFISRRSVSIQER